MTPAQMAATHAAAFTQSRPWRAAEFADLLANPYTYVLGNEKCFALFQIVAGEAELLTIATHPDHQRRRLALACMRNWQEKAALLGANRAFLDVAADNAPAIALYDRCGYVPCGLRRGYYRRQGDKNADAILMERSLP